jgi:hypothetical protein
MEIELHGTRLDIGLRKRPRGEVVAFGKCMAALAMLKSKDPINGFQVEIFEDATVDVPIQVIAKAADRYMRTPDVWRPDPGTFLQMCEVIRLEMREQLKFAPCVNCSKDGWIERTIDGVKRMVKCSCWHAHQQQLQALGVGAEPLALPAGRSGDFSQVADDVA